MQTNKGCSLGPHVLPLDEKITITEVRKTCQKLKNRKAVGIDLMTNELIKHDNVIEL